ncbi:uncharacterized protein LOC121835605 [Ixodes scapularis]|uniref:uncharacterized protein LOC121835605 n=1 Tax=Ixodes scapularis TaxID=6945 RepID=UPI001C388ABB|nr:uncharacterized protein LOC121835605 [Ixodes scapularis]
MNCGLTVLTEEGRVLQNPGEHTYAPNDVSVNSSRLKCTLKERAIAEPDAASPEMYSQHMRSLVGKVEEDVLAQLPTFESVRRTIYRAKRQNQPTLPKTTADVNLAGTYTETLDGRKFLLFDLSTSAGHIICFSTSDALTEFSEASEVFVDGTFFACPSLFYQLLTISVVKGRCSFNVAYFLLPANPATFMYRPSNILGQLELTLAFPFRSTLSERTSNWR